ncbi:MAG: lipopolysaccharide biosynthesis protein [Thermoguttaceae bacterium]
MSSLEQALRQGSRAVIACQIASQVIALGVLAVLYRELGLEPYGFLGMVMPLLLLVRIVVISGLDVATIQQDELSGPQVSAMFWVNQTLGVAMALLTAACAPLLVWFYGVREVGPLTVALAGTSLAAAVGTQHLALLQRHMRLGSLALVQLASLTLGGAAAIGAAWAGWGVWALVVQRYGELLTLALLAWLLEPWRPSFRLRGTGARHLIRFGGHYTISSLMFYLVANVDKVLVGFFLGEAPLALYSQAFNLMMRPIHVVITPLTGIMLPTLSRAAGDRRQYTQLALGFFRFIGLVMLPAGMGLAIVAPEAMRVLGGHQWAAAGPVLRVLALAILVQGFFNALGSVFTSAGRTDRLSKASVVIAIVLVTAFLLGLHLGHRAGVPLLGVALGYSLTLLLVIFPPYLLVALRTVGIRPTAWLAQFAPAIPATLLMSLLVGACHWLLGRIYPLPDLALLGVEISVGVASYAFLVRRELGWLLKQGLRAEVRGSCIPKPEDVS